MRKLGAAAAYRRVIEVNPERDYYYLNLGGVLIELEALDEAVDCFDQALKLSPENQKAYLGLGKARNAQGDLDQSVSAYQASRISCQIEVP